MSFFLPAVSGFSWVVYSILDRFRSYILFEMFFSAADFVSRPAMRVVSFRHTIVLPSCLCTVVKLEPQCFALCSFRIPRKYLRNLKANDVISQKTSESNCWSVVCMKYTTVTLMQVQRRINSRVLFVLFTYNHSIRLLTKIIQSVSTILKVSWWKKTSRSVHKAHHNIIRQCTIGWML